MGREGECLQRTWGPFTGKWTSEQLWKDDWRGQAFLAEELYVQSPAGAVRRVPVECGCLVAAGLDVKLTGQLGSGCEGLLRPDQDFRFTSRR